MIRVPSRSAVTNGSMTKAASTSPLASAAPISGKSTSESLTRPGSTPDFSSDALTTTSAMLLSVLTATVLPARSSTSRIGPSAVTISAPKSSWPASWAEVPGAIASIGSPLEAAMSSETTFEPPTWTLPLTSAGTVAAPPWAVWRLDVELLLAEEALVDAEGDEGRRHAGRLGDRHLDRALTAVGAAALVVAAAAGRGQRDRGQPTECAPDRHGSSSWSRPRPLVSPEAADPTRDPR